jgi:three-Cys-motif partner protein
MLSTPAASRFQVFQGDCNVVIDQLVTKIPLRALTLAFIDPEALHVRFDTVQVLASQSRVDLLVLFADRMDIVRNVDRYEKQTDSKLDQMLGQGANWRQGWAALSNRTPLNICRFFADLYEQQLRSHLGYVTFGEKEMSTQRGPIYRLIYASKHPKGLEFWNKITKRDHGGQLGFF